VSSERRYEGYLMLDHHESPGVSDETIKQINGNTNAKLPTGAGHGLFELATFSCSHCPNVVYIHPLRNRPRGHCFTCHKRLCDSCDEKKALGLKCKTYKQQMDELQELGFLIEEQFKNG